MRTGDEFRELFNLKYNNVNSGQAPGLNDYDISLYLSDAQRQIIESFYSGSIKGYTYEAMEKIRKNLSVITKKNTLPINSIDTFRGFKRYIVNFEENRP